MIEIQIDNLFVVQNQIERLSRGVSDNRYLLMRRLAGTMRYAVAQNFKQGGRPEWLAVKHRSGIPLNNTGALRQSIDELSDNDTALVGTNMIYAAIHQFGGWVGRGNAVFIPARPFLQLTGEDKQDLLDDVQDYFANLTR